ncbi:S41 family peptidase [Maribacter sp. 2-571]|uniref:S41 family peptidase n=1 Tax=Maribacter sp. 2-571 TaxID=3417569 RepID=UPI003D327DF5
MRKFLSFALITGLLFTACNNDDGPDTPEPTGQEPLDTVNVVSQDFIWKATNLWYFWQQDVPNLADDAFTTTEDYTDFLASESDPGALFDNKLRFAEDRFTFYSSNYKELTQSLSGVSSSNGLEFGLVRFNTGNDLFGYVQYIEPNSDAAGKNIARGDLFTGVDGQALTLDNYIGLLFGDNSTYTLNLATISNNTITPTDEEVTLTKQAGFQSQPILMEKIIEQNGRRIGYLVYNQFLDEFDTALNEVFGRFKSEGITDLVLDLRYNPGGSVLTSQRLASMIYDNSTDRVFSKSIYNDKYNAFLTAENVDVNRYFQDNVEGQALNSLNLSQVYVIALRSSASASELVINSLVPYMDVIHVGDTTRGKNEFSTTMVDDVNSNFGPYIYNPERENEINPDNQWAIQPLIGRSANADGFFDYTSGLIPDIVLEEEIDDLGVLGDENEPLLKAALDAISGVSAKSGRTTPRMPINDFSTSKMNGPTKDNMYVKRLPAAMRPSE